MNLGETVTLTAVSFAPSVFPAGQETSLAPPTRSPSRSMGTKRSEPGSPPRRRFPPALIAFWRGETDASDLIGGHHGAFFSGATAIAPRVTAVGKVGGAFTFRWDGAYPSAGVRRVEAGACHPGGVGVSHRAKHSPKQLPVGHYVADTWYLGVFNGYPQFFVTRGHLMEGSSAIPLNEWTHLAHKFRRLDQTALRQRGGRRPGGGGLGR